MSKAIMYTANTSNQTVNEGGNISLGNIIRKFGKNINLNGDSINVCGQGYYDMRVSVTLAPTEEGEVTVSVLKDGVVVPGMTASATAAAAGDLVNLSIVGVVRQFCQCANGDGIFTIVLTQGNATIANIGTVTEKL